MDPFDLAANPQQAEEQAAGRKLPAAPGGQVDPFDLAENPLPHVLPREMHEALTAGKTWDEFRGRLKELGANPETVKQHYELAQERIKQGRGVGTFEQFGRASLPGVSAVVNYRREGAYHDASERFKAGKATAEDMQTITAYERRQAADREMSSTVGGSLVQTLGQVPTVLGEMYVGGKVVGAGAKAFGLGRVAPIPMQAAQNPSTAAALGGFAARQAALTPFIPSMYLEKAAQLNVEAGRDPRSLKAMPTALGVAYANMLVLGSLQKLGNSGSFADQIVQKGAAGVVEQQAADVGVSLVDEVLNKGYKSGTRYGTLGHLARGEAGEGLKAVATQMFTFSLFAGLHGKHNPEAVLEAGADLLNANAKAGMAPDRAAKYQAALQGRLGQAVYEADRQGREFTREDARGLFAQMDAAGKGMTPEQFEATKRYVAELVNAFPEKGAVKRDYRAAKGMDATRVDEQTRMGDEGPVHEPVTEEVADRPLSDAESLAIMRENDRQPVAEGLPAASSLATRPAPPVPTGEPAGFRGKKTAALPDPLKGEPAQAYFERLVTSEGATTDQARAVARGHFEGFEPGKAEKPASPLDGMGERDVADLATALLGVKRGAKITPKIRAELESLHPDVLAAVRQGPAKPPGPPPVRPATVAAPESPVGPPGARQPLPDARARNAAGDAAQRAAQAGEAHTYVDMDVDNMGGLGKRVGREKADEHARAAVEIVREELAKVGATEVYRHAGHSEGDEHSAIVKAPKAAVDAALRAADSRITQYAREHGLADLEYHKEAGINRPFGVSAFAESFGRGDARTVYAEAEAGTETVKARKAERNRPAPAEPAVTPPPAPDRFAKARARSAEPLAKTAAPVTRPEPEADERTAAERRQDERIEKTRYEDVPKVYRDRIEKYVPDLGRSGLSPEDVRERARVVYGASGVEGVEALADHYEARFGTPTDKLLAVAEQKARQAEEEVNDAVAEATGDTGRGVEAGDRRSAEAAARLRARVDATLAEADRVADQATDGRPTAAAAPAPQPRRKKGKGVSAADRARDAVAAYKRHAEKMKPLEDEYNALPPDSPRRAEMDAGFADTDAEYARLEAERNDALKALAKKNNRQYAVYAVDGAGAKPRETGRYDTLDGANTAQQAEGYRLLRDDPAVHTGREVTDEYGEKGSAADSGTTDGSNRVYVKAVGYAEPKAGTKVPRVKTVVDRVIEDGGIKWDAEMDRFFGGQAEARERGLNRPGTFSKDGRRIEDVAAEYYPDDPDRVDRLIEDLLGDRPDRDADNAKAFAAEQERYERERYAGGTEGQFTPSGEIPESRGQPRPGASSLPTGPGEKPTDFQVIAAQDEIFGVRNYVEGQIPGAGPHAQAQARVKGGATVTGKMAAGDPLVNLEEHAHHLQEEIGLPSDPAKLPRPVAAGLAQFFGPRAKDYPKATPETVVREGFADWVIARSTDRLDKLTPEQKIANEYLERLTAEKGQTAKLDAVRDLYRRAKGRTAAEEAAGNVSPTGKPAGVQGEPTLAEKAQEVVDDNLTVLQRLLKYARSLGHKVTDNVYHVYSQLMHADPARAAEFERDGVHTYVDGRKVVIGASFAKIVEGAKPEWVKPGENGEASRAGTYAVARHVLGEEARGRTGLVSDVQLEGYRRAMEEFKNDKEFIAWAEPFAQRLSDAFNATRRALAGKDVHFLSQEEVDEWVKKYPDYIPTDRVRQDAGWKARVGTKGEVQGGVTGERSGSGEQIVDPLLSYKNRLKVTSAVMGEQLKRIAVEKVLKLEGMEAFAAKGETVLTDLGKQRADVLKSMGFEGEELRDILKSMGVERAEEYFTSKPWPADGSKPTWGVRGEDGKLVTYRIGDRQLYDLITGQQVEASALASWVKALANFWPVRMFTQAVKFGATTASLGFQFRNIARDAYTFFQNTIDRATVGQLPDAYKRAYAHAWHTLTGGESTDALFKRFVKDRGDQLRQFAFDPDKPKQAYEVQDRRSVWGILKDTLGLAGAGELAPRFLEWKTRLQQVTGKTEAELTSSLDAAEKAAADGKHAPDPIPLALALDAMHHAAEVTVNFNRQGTVTREVNKITPFFGPAIAGMSREVRNWKTNPKGAALALAGLLGARLLHWALYSDEEWYQELNANDRYNNFVVPTPAGLRRFPGPRGLDSSAGGLLVLAMDAAADKNPDVKGYLKQQLNLLPPAPVPPPVKAGFEIASNENWQGSPIVPRREEDTSTMDKWIARRGPYAIDQLTGGLVSGRKVPDKAADLIPFGEVRNARRSVDEFFDQFLTLQEERTKATRQGLRFPQEAEYQRLEGAQKKIVELGRASRGERLVNGKVVKGEEPPEEKKAELKKKQIELARKALGR